LYIIADDFGEKSPVEHRPMKAVSEASLLNKAETGI
jgi:hypothetical protein